MLASRHKFSPTRPPQYTIYLTLALFQRTSAGFFIRFLDFGCFHNLTLFRLFFELIQKQRFFLKTQIPSVPMTIVARDCLNTVFDIFGEKLILIPI
jgi:hypothetical protein